MKITNTDVLPKPLIAALERQYSPSFELDEEGMLKRIRVTALLDSPYKQKLDDEHHHELEETAHGALAAALGNGFHHWMEDFKLDDCICELEVSRIVDGVEIVGHIDLIELGISGNGWVADIIDYKVSGASALKFPKPEFEQQLNVYAYLVANKYTIGTLSNFYLFRDWSPQKKKWTPNYPEHRYARVFHGLWNEETVLSFIRSRIAAWNSGMPCSLEERWHKPEKYRVKLPGKTKGSIFDSLREALDFMEKQDTLCSMEVLPERYLRCEEYCSSAKWCEHLFRKYPR